MLCAPWGVQHLADFALGDIARDDAIEQACGVPSRDQVLVERRDVEQGRGAAHGVILAFVAELVRAGHHVSRPPPPGLSLHESGSAGMERGLFQDGHADSAGAKNTSTSNSSELV